MPPCPSSPCLLWTLRTGYRIPYAEVSRSMTACKAACPVIGSGSVLSYLYPVFLVQHGSCKLCHLLALGGTIPDFQTQSSWKRWQAATAVRDTDWTRRCQTGAVGAGRASTGKCHPAPSPVTAASVQMAAGLTQGSWLLTSSPSQGSWLGASVSCWSVGTEAVGGNRVGLPVVSFIVLGFGSPWAQPSLRGVPLLTPTALGSQCHAQPCSPTSSKSVLVDASNHPRDRSHSFRRQNMEKHLQHTRYTEVGHTGRSCISMMFITELDLKSFLFSWL